MLGSWQGRILNIIILLCLLLIPPPHCLLSHLRNLKKLCPFLFFVWVAAGVDPEGVLWHGHTPPLAVLHISSWCRVLLVHLILWSSWAQRMSAAATTHPFLSHAALTSGKGKEGKGEQQQHSLPGLQSQLVRPDSAGKLRGNCLRGASAECWLGSELTVCTTQPKWEGSPRLSSFLDLLPGRWEEAYGL